MLWYIVMFFNDETDFLIISCEICVFTPRWPLTWPRSSRRRERPPRAASEAPVDHTHVLTCSRVPQYLRARPGSRRDAYSGPKIPNTQISQFSARISLIIKKHNYMISWMYSDNGSSRILTYFYDRCTFLFTPAHFWFRLSPAVFSRRI